MLLRTCLLAALPAMALAGPTSLTHQGRLLDSAGSPLNGAQSITVELWKSADSTDTEDRWSSQTVSVTANEGYFAVDVLADTDWFAQGPVWLTTGVDGVALSARQPIRDAPMAAVSRVSLGVSVATEALTTPCTDGALTLDQSDGAGVLRVCTGGEWLPPIADGNNADSAASSCAALLASNPDASDGVYWIKTSDALGPRQVYCDMTTADGGWTLCMSSRYTGAARGLFDEDYKKVYAEDPFGFYDWCETTHDEYLFTLADIAGPNAYEVKTATVHLRDARPYTGASEFSEVGIVASTDTWTWVNTPSGLQTGCSGDVALTFWQYTDAAYRGLNGYKRGWIWCTVNGGSGTSGVSLVMGTGCNYASCPSRGWPFNHSWDSNVFPTWSQWTMRLVSTAGNGNGSWKAGPFEEDRTLIFYR